MEQATFDKVVAVRIAEIKKLMAAKGQEYARGDRLSNFKYAAQIERTTPETSLLGKMTKHWVSIVDMIKDLDSDTHNLYTRWDEKINDSIIYLILLDALIIERADKITKKIAGGK